MAVVLDHAEDRDRKAEVRKRLLCGRGMGVAAVDEQQVGKLGKLLVPVLCARKAAVHHLVHAGVVVRAVEVADAKLPVVALEGLAVHMHGHARDDAGGTEV